MVRAYVYDGEVLAGVLEFDGLSYSFLYDDDFIALANLLDIPQKMAKRVIKDFLLKEKATLALLDNSFLSDRAKERYKALLLDRVKALSYSFCGKY